MTINQIVKSKPEVITNKSKYYSMDNRVLNAALKFYKIKDTDIDKGLRHIKQVTKRRSRELYIKFHPDTHYNKKPPTGHSLNLAIKYNKLIQSLEWIPMNNQNFDRVLEISKGYDEGNIYE